MKNPNSKINRIKRWFLTRWSAEDYPTAESRFRISLFGKDIGIFIALPLISIIIFRGCQGSTAQSKRSTNQNKTREINRLDTSKSQIIDFKSPNSGLPASGVIKKSAGTLVKVKLLNVVETYSNAPVHAQIIDNGLGINLRGGILIGDATPDTNFERININFRIARDPIRDGIAFPLTARALSLDGTLGLDATKKQGFIARATIDSTAALNQNTHGGSESSDFKDILFKALTAGLVQEFGAKNQAEKNRSQVLTLQPATIFFVELMDTFPGGQK